MRLSYATLGAFTKYPKESLPKKPTNHIADKKYGFFQSEKDLFLDVANELGLLKTGSKTDCSFARHPLTYLVEAADDICYTIIDFEDGINLGLIQEEFALEYLINLVKHSINSKKYNKLSTTQDRVSYLRALAINTLIQEAVEIFLDHEEDILNNNFSTGLLDKSKYEAQINDIINISIKNVYKSQEVIDKEIVGYKVISTLLDVYSAAVINKSLNQASNYDALLLKSIPELNYCESNSTYQKLLGVCHYVSLLSDSQAILKFKKIKGISL